MTLSTTVSDNHEKCLDISVMIPPLIYSVILFASLEILLDKRSIEEHNHGFSLILSPYLSFMSSHIEASWQVYF